MTNRLLQKSPQSASPEQDPVGAILAVFRYRLIPDLLLDVALVKAMLDGPQAALRSGFSVS